MLFIKDVNAIAHQEFHSYQEPYNQRDIFHPKCDYDCLSRTLQHRYSWISDAVKASHLKSCISVQIRNVLVFRKLPKSNLSTTTHVHHRPEKKILIHFYEIAQHPRHLSTENSQQFPTSPCRPGNGEARRFWHWVSIAAGQVIVYMLHQLRCAGGAEEAQSAGKGAGSKIVKV